MTKLGYFSSKFFMSICEENSQENLIINCLNKNVYFLLLNIFF